MEGSWRDYFDRIAGAGPRRRPAPPAAPRRPTGRGRRRSSAKRPPCAPHRGRPAPAAASARRPDRPRHPARRHRAADPRRRHARRREHGGEPRRPHGHLDAHHPGADPRGEPRASSTSTATPPGARKISFTHLVAWAILRALDTFPRLNDAYAELDGQPHRIQRDSVRLGIAVDVQKQGRHAHPAGAQHQGRRPARLRRRSCAAFDDLVARRARARISPDDFLGTTISLTNPGTVGTTSSAPRLMPGQGADRRHRRPRLPGRVPRRWRRSTLSLLGISKVMTLTCTYDHRIIQGAESGLFLARIEELLRGRGRLLRADLRGPEAAAPPGALGDRRRPRAWAAPRAAARRSRSRPGSCSSSTPTACAATWSPTSIPLDSKRAPAHGPRPRHLRPDPVGPRPRVPHRTASRARDRATLREILEMLRETYCGTIGVEYMNIADPERKEWLQERMESARNRLPLDTAEQRRDPREAHRGRELRAVPARELRRPQALLARGLRGR